MNDVVIIELDRPRELRFTYSALKKLSAMTGKTVDDLDQNLDPTDFDLFEKLVYFGLLKDAKDNGEELTIEQIPELLDYAPSFAWIIEKTVTAWRATFAVHGHAQATEGNQPAPAVEPAKADSTLTKPSA